MLIAVLLLAFNMVSCKDSNTSGGDDGTSQYITKKIAVVLPMQDGQETHWKRTLNQCAEDLKKAFKGQTVGISLEYEWYDEGTENISDLYYKLFTNTVGSHVTLFNATHYGNLYKDSIGEFL